MYHYVRPLKSSSYPKIKGLEVDQFVGQIEYFIKNYNFISAAQLLNSIYYNVKIPENSILITFDDGLKDHYMHVFPILKKFNIEGLFFPSGSPIENENVLDVHKIHFIIAACKSINDIKKKIFEVIKQYKDEYSLHDPNFYLSNFSQKSRFDNKETVFVKQMLQSILPKKIRHEITSYFFEKYVTKDEVNFSKELYLSQYEIKEMVEGGMYFGSHGYCHEWLDQLSKSDLDEEMAKGNEFLIKFNKNRKSWIMCYPYGRYNDLVLEKLKKQSFRAGLTVKAGNALLDRKNAFTLNRYDTNDFLH